MTAHSDLTDREIFRLAWERLLTREWFCILLYIVSFTWPWIFTSNHNVASGLVMLTWVVLIAWDELRALYRKLRSLLG